MTTELDALRTFVRGMHRLLRDHDLERTFLPQCGALLSDLISQDRWLPAALSQCGSDSYRQYLLYRHPESRFSVVSFAWGPGQQTPIHDHCVWGVIGVLRGTEEATSYVLEDNQLVERDTRTLQAGDLDFVSPRLGDIHRVRNPSQGQDAVSIHVYGADIGAVKRHTYELSTGKRTDFVSGYGNDVPPDLGLTD